MTMEVNILQLLVLGDVIGAIISYAYLFLSFRLWAPALWSSICVVLTTVVLVGFIFYIYLMAAAMRHSPPRSWEISFSRIHGK